MTTGVGHGVENYFWTAVRHLEILIDVVFGLHFDGLARRLTVRPLTVPLSSGNTVMAEQVQLGNSVVSAIVSIQWSAGGETRGVSLSSEHCFREVIASPAALKRLAK